MWQYINDDRDGETSVRPAKKIPVTNLTGKLIGTTVQLANGDRVWALISNVDFDNPRLTEHFLTVSLHRNGKWFHLSRYHDLDYPMNGPTGLAKFLGLEVNQIFPISYDVSRFVSSGPNSRTGLILKEPPEKLTRAELIAMSVP